MNMYFYDLETSGVNPRLDRIMQFAGQRTDMNLKPIGKPDNFLIKLSSDILPQPDAVLVHGISPQKTIKDGMSEAQAVKYLSNQVFTPDTISVGFNNVRFDDEFMRYLFWRNFTDAYEWQWKDGRSRWDLLDMSRMTRALRPQGINWPVGPDGRPTNRLELLASINNLEHVDAHDALSDVLASLSVARLIRNKQTKLFDYLLKMRDKKKVAVLTGSGEPFVYTSGRYSSEYEKTTVVFTVAAHPSRDAGIVYDLRMDPNPYFEMSPAELAAAWLYRPTKEEMASRIYKKERFPIKKMAYNRCPAVAPLSVMDADSKRRLQIDDKVISEHLSRIKKHKTFAKNILAALELVEPKRQPELLANELTVDGQLYDGFVDGPDRTKMGVIRAADADSLSTLSLDFDDERLAALLPLYKARNFYSSLLPDEKIWWEDYKLRRLVDGGPDSLLNQYLDRVEDLLKQKPSQGRLQLLLELRAYGDSYLAAGPDQRQ